MSDIKFGTSGWRAVISDEFTFDNVRLVSQAIANYLKQTGEAQKGIVIGYDTRFLSEKFAEATAAVMMGNDIKVFFSDRDIPTPAISYEILRLKAGGAINFTASHNPYNYNGIKFSQAWGGPALPESTQRIEKEIALLKDSGEISELSVNLGKERGLYRELSGTEYYLPRLQELVDFDLIRKAGLKMVVNPLYGTSRGYLDEILIKHGCAGEVINNERDVYFGGFPPEPATANIGDMIDKVKETGASLGLATDGDADRFGIVDRDGEVITPNFIITLLLIYLVKNREYTGGAARSVATTHFIDAVAQKEGIELFETPVGFKYIGELISQDKIIIGGEESAGLSIRGHVPEKDGLLACLLTAEMVAHEKKSLRQLIQGAYDYYGAFYNQRINLRLTDEQKVKFRESLDNPPAFLAGKKVTDVITIDGVKLMLADNSWVLFRFSGTEPVVRIYAEANNPETVRELLDTARQLID